MRIISGFLKGKKINYLRNTITRPLKDNVKENIFNIIQHSSFIDVKIKSANVLDLFSGIGSFGIECISRDAKKVTFVERDFNAIKTLKENLIKHSIIKKVSLLNSEIERAIDNCKKEKFNIFFFDPPFVINNIEKYLYLIKKNKMYKKKHIVIIHREKKTEDNLNEFLKTIKIKKYGRSKIIFGFFI
jgi:16S rRNA (guanine966-N2)-methyltransferase